MMGSAPPHKRPEVGANQAGEKAAGPTPGLVVAVLVHAGLLAWGLFEAHQLRAAMCLASCGALAGTAALALLLIFWMAAFGSRRALLTFVVFPALLGAGAWAYVISELLVDSSMPRSVLAGLLGFGAQSVAVILSFGAAAVAARNAPRWGSIDLARAPSFWVGALGLAAVLGVSTASRQVTPIAAACAAIGIVALGASLRGAEQRRRQGAGMAELVSGVTLSLGAIWAASVAAGASEAAEGLGDWRPASTAMRFAWLAAVPLVLAAVVALAPRASSAGLGISRSRTAVITTAVGVVVCMGLSKVVLARTSPLLVAASQAAPPTSPTTPPRRPVPEPEPPPSQPPHASASAASAGSPGHTGPEPVDSLDAGTEAAAPTEKVPEAPAVGGVEAGVEHAPAPTPIVGGDAGRPPQVEPVGEGGEVVTLSHDTQQLHIGLRVDIFGPMSPDVARQGVIKSFKRLVACYEAAESEGQPATASLKFSVSAAGGVRNVDFVGPQGAPAQYVACLQLAFLRTGFQMSPDKTELGISVEFTPKN